MGNVHVANGSKRQVRVHIGHNMISVPEIEASGKAGHEPYKLSTSVRATIDTTLQGLDLVLVAPNEALYFRPDLAEDDIYVTMVTVSDPAPIVLCYNSCLPQPGLSLILTQDGSLQLSKPCGKFWKTKTGLLYEQVENDCPHKK